MENIVKLVAFGVLVSSIDFTATAQQTAQNQANAHVAGVAPLGVTVTAMDAVMVGWSAKKSILGKPVLNDQKQKIGTIDDIIITPEDSVSFAIIGAGGFLGMGKHDVAIPMNQIKAENNNLVLPGATKQALKALPAFEYRKGK